VISRHVVIRAAPGSRRSFDLVCRAPNQHLVCSPSLECSGGFDNAVTAHIDWALLEMTEMEGVLILVPWASSR
jgi:hypothetical protein